MIRDPSRLLDPKQESSMSKISDDYEAACIELDAAAAAYAAADDRLIKARRAKREIEIAYYREMFPTLEALEAHFRS
jgi:hypothetical protein